MTPVWNTPVESPSSGTVLIVDDDEETLRTYAWMLRSEGFTVLTASNAADGLAAAEHHPPDAILVDLRMPMMDGVEFLQRFRARDGQRGTPVALVTGDYVLDETIVADLQALGAGIQLKPLWLEDLLALVRRLLVLRPEPAVRR